MKENTTIKELIPEERPYEKCERFGAEHLTNIELLAVLLRTGTKGENSMQLARRILYPEHGVEGLLNLHQWDFTQLMHIKGIGKVKAIQILCLCELTKRLAKEHAKEGLRFSTPASIADYFMEEMRHLEQEVMKVLFLDTKTKLIGQTDISKGTVNATMISPRELFIEALQKKAVSIILLHNHPSGDPTPSRDDVMLSRRIRDAGALIGIELLDHIIIGDQRYISLQETGLLS